MMSEWPQLSQNDVLYDQVTGLGSVGVEISTPISGCTFHQNCRPAEGEPSNQQLSADYTWYVRKLAGVILHNLTITLKRKTELNSLKVDFFSD